MVLPFLKAKLLGVHYVTMVPDIEHMMYYFDDLSLGSKYLLRRERLSESAFLDSLGIARRLE